jgi:NAD(P)-dependent dehydrogenase (short-subunit alcohol dehydrogenase family)
MVARTVAAYGRLDCAFNNAGVGGSGPLMESSEADFDRMIAVNLKGVFLCMRFELAQMLKQGSGAIVNDSSGAGLVAGSYNAVYAASKFGVVALTKSAALSYGRNGIRVNAVCPGYTRTPMLEAGLARDPSLEKKFELRTPLHRIADAREVAEAAVWLCSDAASFINGVALPVDGGLTAGNHWPPNQ